MSATSRWIIAIFAGVCAVSFAAVALIVVFAAPPDVMSVNGIWAMAGFCLITTVACVRGRLPSPSGPLIGAGVCAVFLLCAVSVFSKPILARTTYHRNDANTVAGAMGSVLFGVAGGYLALTGGRLRLKVEDDGERG